MGGFVKLADESLLNQIQLVKELCDKNTNSISLDENKLVNIWKASFAKFKSWEDGSANYDPLINGFFELATDDGDFGEIKNSNDLAKKIARHLCYTLTNGIDNVIDIDKGADLNNTNNVVLFLTPGGLSLPSREYYTDEKFADKREMFKQHLKNVYDLINTKQSVQLNDNFVQDIMDFENQLARYIMKSAQSRRYDEYYTNTTLTDVHQKINELRSLPDKKDNYTNDENNFNLTDEQKETIKVFLEEVYQQMKLREKLINNREQYFISKGVVNPPHEEQIITFDGDGLRRILALILNKDNYNKYRSYLEYKIICAAKGFCTKELDDEFFDFYSRKLNGQLQQKPIDKRSIQIVNNYADELLGKGIRGTIFPRRI